MTKKERGEGLVEIRSREILLGETTYTVKEAPYVRTRKFWPLLTSQVTPLTDKAASAAELGPDSSISDFMQLVPAIEKLILEAPVAVLDAICTYAPQLEADRAEIEATATDRQIVRALLTLMEMSDPFDTRRIVSRGLSRIAPSSSSPAPSGE